MPKATGCVRCFVQVVALAAISVVLAAPAGASALPTPTLLATTGGSGDSTKTAVASDLYSLNPSTGAATSLGNTGYSIGALAQDPTTGVLYAASNHKSPGSPDTLLTLNPATGAATPIGQFGEFRVTDLAFDVTGQLYAWVETEDLFARIDKATGVVTTIGEGTGSAGSGLTFDASETLWFFGGGEEGPYYSVDPATGEVTERGELTPVDEEDASISAATTDCAQTTIYGSLNNFGEPPANLLTIDTATGQLVNKGSTVTSIDGLEWYCPLAFEFAVPAQKLGATATSVTLAVNRGPRIRGAASVGYVASGAGSANGTLAFPNTVTQQSLTLPITKDPTAGEARVLTVQLSNPSGGGTVGPAATVEIATTKPTLTVKGPKSTENSRPTFKIKSNQRPASFKCKLDKGKFKKCGKSGKKPKKFKTKALDPGKHKLVVQAVNGEGKKSKQVKKKFTILP
jgi:hypothetical protein